jgi:hypothetical protein
VDHYIKAFKWNSGKYRTDRPLREIMTTLVEVRYQKRNNRHRLRDLKCVCVD